MSSSPVLLALDTAGACPGVAVRSGDGRILARYLDPASSKRCEGVAALTSALLADAGVGVDRIDSIAVVTGPGSYTGLRTGLAFVRGLAFVGSTKVIAVGALELLAYRGGRRGRTVAALADAGSGRFYLGLYRHDGECVLELTAVTLADLEQVRAAIGDLEQGTEILVAADARSHPGAVAASSLHECVLVDDQSAAALAQLGQFKASRGHCSAASDVLPCYIGTSSPKPNQQRVASSFARPEASARHPE
ncbi:MAG TPA: tRNA (adenosine(37)-N6)-threonylcarbamoyltransferase complex dimerization subunit type 1 TsaB [Candidatus Binatia bacterium]|nr:tRNA (adenosine(37)-N6)-threonylcarbamoyltransferase complex dimerization subunit type 1 TsaB [Candidatus Binatia bacterium]